jgi:DNA polymerase-3 subunit epsilon
MTVFFNHDNNNFLELSLMFEISLIAPLILKLILKMYAILDIETTGGNSMKRITEIAIYKFDGHEIVDQFISLVNPEIPIQPFVVKLTGINNAMLTSAPKF